ncbi:MAG: NAD(P)H-dependent oxidoreductase, partial [Treponema sp.]|nr:NAD(P)H-dependent oxidoreductase [Treponema sp.]
MNILIHDRKDINKILKDNSEKTVVISDNGKIKPCICCFGCWIKTPGQCVIKDGFDNMGELWSKCNKLTIISQCFYGGYSPFVKNVLDRSVCPYQLPYFIKTKGEMRHPKRYK